VRETAVLDSGIRKPAILAVGRSTIACVEREIMMPDSAQPGLLRRVSGSWPEDSFFEWVLPATPADKPLGENVAYH
jgi:hypothetical protein